MTNPAPRSTDGTWMSSDIARPLGRRERILIIGASGHARVAIDLVETSGEYEIAGLIDRDRPTGEQVMGHSIVGREVDVPRLAESLTVTGCFIAIGDNHVRGLVAERLSTLAPRLRFVTLVHPAATVARAARIGAGTIVMAGVVVGASARVGDLCILNTACSVDHESIVHDHASVAPGARLGGRVEIGAYSAIGIGASVIHEVRIGAHSVIGAGATVLHPVDDYRVAYGVPATVVRARTAGERYL